MFRPREKVTYSLTSRTRQSTLHGNLFLDLIIHKIGNLLSTRSMMSSSASRVKEAKKKVARAMKKRKRESTLVTLTFKGKIRRTRSPSLPFAFATDRSIYQVTLIEHGA